MPSSKIALHRPPEEPPQGYILVVDDEEVIRELLLEFLNRNGLDTRAASTGEEGLAMDQQDPCTIAMVDYGLPGINGLEACRRLGLQNPSCRRILMTGWNREDLPDCTDKIQHILTKPFDLFAVLNVIREGMRRRTLYPDRELESRPISRHPF